MSFEGPSKRTMIPITVTDQRMVEIHEPALTDWDETSDIFVDRLIELSGTTNVSLYFGQVKLCTADWAVMFANKVSDRLAGRSLSTITVGSKGTVSDLIAASLIAMAQIKRYPNYELIYEAILDQRRGKANAVSQ